MDRLIEDYEKALTEEFELRLPMEQIQENVRKVKAYRMYRLIELDPKLPQWKAQEIILVTLDRQEGHPELKQKLRDAELAHGKANIRLAVTHERIELTKARLYGGHHDLLDLREMAPAPDQAVD